MRENDDETEKREEKEKKYNKISKAATEFMQKYSEDECPENVNFYYVPVPEPE